ncbi:MAG: AraC family transcriptional regulator [Bacteroidota bacterium]
MQDSTQLPQDLGIKIAAAIQGFLYTNDHHFVRSKISLAKNTISFLRAGTKEVIGDGQAVKINNDQFILMKSGNCLMTEKASETDTIYRSTLLFFSDELVIDFLERNHLYTNEKSNRHSFYVFKYDYFLGHFAESIENILKLPTPTQEKILRAKFEELMLYLCHLYGASFLNTLIQRVDDTAQRLINIVEHNKYNKLSLPELSFLANMSLSTFKREFFKQYHTTPIKWFSEKRLEHVALLLRAHKKRPIDLYEEAGYENFSNFVQAFKKKFGVTPKQYQVQ